MPERLTDADLVDMLWNSDLDGPSADALRMKHVQQLVAEVRRLRAVLTRIADGDGWGSTAECACAEISQDALGKEQVDG